jgi:glycosidase
LPRRCKTWNRNASQTTNDILVENGAAVFEIPVTNRAGNLNLVVHNGDLKSPVFDLTLVPQSFATGAWVVQDIVLAGLGVKGIWLMPVTESADNDHGYAVEDYRAIEQQYGTMTDFELLLIEAHNRGIAVIIDYVINHSASTNPLFLDASTSSANDKRNWYVWEANQPVGWNTFAGDPWRNNGNGWYYGVFSSQMPDFNLRDPDVVEFHKDNLRFWLNKGVDEFRFDAVSVLFENGSSEWEETPENHTFLGEMQALIDGYNKRYIVCEAPASPADYAAATSCGSALAFQVPGAILNSAGNSTVASSFVDQLKLARTDYMPLILSNHDS